MSKTFYYYVPDDGELMDDARDVSVCSDIIDKKKIAKEILTEFEDYNSEALPSEPVDIYVLDENKKPFMIFTAEPIWIVSWNIYIDDKLCIEDFE
jgi:hypothetical protein